jgi:hypothetical protein
MIVFTHDGRGLHTDRAITERRAFRTTSYDSNVLSHAALVKSYV